MSVKLLIFHTNIVRLCDVHMNSMNRMIDEFLNCVDVVDVAMRGQFAQVLLEHPSEPMELVGDSLVDHSITRIGRFTAASGLSISGIESDAADHW